MPRSPLPLPHRPRRAARPAGAPALIAGLTSEWTARTAALRPSPVDTARTQLRGACWTIALQTLRDAYPEDAARAAWLELLAEPESGWSVQRPNGAWVPYCVPGYDGLCGDVVVPGCPLPSSPSRPAAGVAMRRTVLPDPLPIRPWRVPDGLSWCQRLLGLIAISDAGVSDPDLRALVLPIVARVDAALARAHIDDPNERAKACARLILRRIQACGYRTDPPGQNWWQPVAWTLKRGGTCEALSAALRAAMIVAGVPVEMVWIDQTTENNAPLNHASCLVWYDGGWQWADASVPAALDENPYVVAALDDRGTNARGDGLG